MSQFVGSSRSNLNIDLFAALFDINMRQVLLKTTSNTSLTCYCVLNNIAVVCDRIDLDEEYLENNF